MKLTKEMLVSAGLDPSRMHDPDFVRVLEDAFEIQDRFVAEPIFAKTGKGFLKSVGVKEIEAAKRVEKSTPQK